MKNKLTIFLLFISIISLNSYSNEKSNNQDISDFLNQIKKEINALNLKMPQKIDTETELNEVLIIDLDVIYKMTLIKLRYSDFDIAVFNENMFNYSKKIICTDKSFSNFLKNNMNILYAYYDRDSKYVTTVKIKKEDC